MKYIEGPKKKQIQIILYSGIAIMLTMAVYNVIEILD